MKKLYTLLLLISFSVTAQMPVNLLTDGNFEANNAAEVWYGNVEIRNDNPGSGAADDNYYFFADVLVAGDSYNVNLSQVVTLTQGDTYTLSFEASTGVGNTRSILAGIGQSGEPYQSVTEEVDITNDNTITYSYDFVASFAGPYRVLFDMGADTGIVVIDNVSLIKKDVPQDTLYYPRYEGTFGGTSRVQTFLWPTGTEPWAGFGNTNANIYPLDFPNGGQITFTASADAATTIKFKFEKDAHPNVDPSYTPAEQAITTTPTAYSIPLSATASGTNTYKSALLYLLDRDVAVNISDIKIEKFDTDGTVLTTSYPIYDGPFGNATYSHAFTFPAAADSWGGFSNTNMDVSPVTLSNGGKITFKASATAATSLKFRFEANAHPNVEPSYDVAPKAITAALADYEITLDPQGANTFNSQLLYVVDRDVTVNISNVVITATAGDSTTNTTLSDLQVDGTTISGFDAGVNSYTYKLPVGTTAIPQITTATTVISGASTVITQATAIPGDATVVVTASDGSTTDTYTVSFKAVIPATAAPTPPARDAAEVISLYSDAYTDVASNFDAGWCGTNSVSEITVAGNATMAYIANPCQGIVLDASVDASTFTNYNVDIFIEPGTDIVGKTFHLKFVGTPTSVVKEVTHDLNALNTSVGEWVSLTGTVDLSTMGGFKEFGITTNLANAVYYDNLYFYIDDTSGGGGGETPTTTTYCDTEVTHFNLPAETASKILLTIENSGADKITISASSAGASPIDVLIVGANDSGGTVSATDITGGVASLDMTWAAGTMPATATFELLWSTEDNPGNWMLEAGTGDQGLGNINTANDCSTASVKDVSFYNIDVYPNPASNVINVRSEFTIDNLSIFDLMGRTVKQQISSNKEFSLDVSDLSKGIYLVKLSSGDKEAVTKFIKK